MDIVTKSPSRSLGAHVLKIIDWAMRRVPSGGLSAHGSVCLGPMISIMFALAAMGRAHAENRVEIACPCLKGQLKFDAQAPAGWTKSFDSIALDCGKPSIEKIGNNPGQLVCRQSIDSFFVHQAPPTSYPRCEVVLGGGYGRPGFICRNNEPRDLSEFDFTLAPSQTLRIDDYSRLNSNGRPVVWSNVLTNEAQYLEKPPGPLAEATRLAVYTGAGTPDVRACRREVNNGGSVRIPISRLAPGSWVCVVEGSGKILRLRINSITGTQRQPRTISGRCIISQGT